MASLDAPIHSGPLNAATLLQTLRDNETSYKIEPVGTIGDTHRFRALPDFQFSASDVPIMKRVVKHLVNPTISDIKGFRLDNTVGATPGTPIVGPPVATPFAQQLNYLYQQNPAVETVTNDQGQTVTINTQAARKRDMYAISTDVAEVPTGPVSSLRAPEESSPRLRDVVNALTELLAERPIVTRRLAMNRIECPTENLFKEATQYVGYSFRSGPWRDALVKYGVDPRKDPKYSIYQTIVIKLVNRDAVMTAAKKLPGGRNRWLRGERYIKDTSGTEVLTHIFDGKGISTNGKMWQICDITDPVLKNMFDTAPHRETPDLDNWGWYLNGTMSICRAIMRDKALLMLRGFDPSIYNEVYSRIAALPPSADENTMEAYSYAAGGRADSLIDSKAQELTSAIRSIARQDLKAKGLQTGKGAGKARPGWDDGAHQSGSRASMEGSPAEGDDQDEQDEDQEEEEDDDGDDDEDEEPISSP